METNLQTSNAVSSLANGSSVALPGLAYLLGILDMLRAYIGTSTASVFSVCVRLAFSTSSGNRTPPERAVASLATNHYATPPSNR
ncbi:hypothetical protein T02_13235 [Trichinella nativa]|uniref:Uncharacterized protein n=1 Tax=Trichinella nativa TaxID=6335 RepID=A0A0V1L9G9_9BILA|nr:hypothetical protein T02_13235 [Trichinella nativa]